MCATSATRASFPYTRGLYPDMYRQRLWTMRQYAGYADGRGIQPRATATCSRSGTTGLSVAFDLPTQIGYDSDHALARGEVGRVGVADRLRSHDMRRLFDGIPLDRVTTSMTINATAPILLALYLAVAEEQGVAWERIGGTVQNDILKEYAARGTYIYPPGPSLRLVTDVIAFCAERVPKWNPISISGYHMREAGSTAVQEVAFTLANGLAYVEAALGRGLAIDEFAPRLSFFFNAHNDFLEEVAKFRAARRLWARADARALRAARRALAVAALPHPDRGLDAHRAAARQQRRAGRASRRWPRSAAARSRSTPTLATRRSACPPRRRRARAAHPAGRSPTRAASPRRRPAGRLAGRSRR